jgi:hypothetical protein
MLVAASTVLADTQQQVPQMLPPTFEPINRVKSYIDTANQRNKYRVVSPSGMTIADGIDSESAARRIACMDELFNAFEFLLECVETDICQNRYALKWCMASYEELAADKEGVYEQEYPGLPDQAEILIELTDLKEHLRTPEYRLVKSATAGGTSRIVGG